MGGAASNESNNQECSFQICREKFPCPASLPRKSSPRKISPRKSLSRGSPTRSSPRRRPSALHFRQSDFTGFESVDYTRLAKPPSTTVCNNPTDFISLEEWQESSEPVFIKSGNVTTCYDYESMMQMMKMEEYQYAVWEGAKDEMGYGGKPNWNRLLFRLPDGYTYITRRGLTLLEMWGPAAMYILRPLYKNIPIGHISGIFGESTAHGQVRVTISELKPVYKK